MNHKPILVFGRSGQLAIEVGNYFSAHGVEHNLAGRPEFDITSKASVDETIERYDPRIVINAAAYTSVDQAETEPELAFSTNCEGVGYVADACAKKGVPLIHISTDYVFDGASRLHYKESGETNPIGVYGHSKLAGERAILVSGCQALILRTAWVFSPHGSNFVKTMLRLAETRDEVSVVNDQVGTPTNAAHLAKSIGKLVEILEVHETRPKTEKPWGIYHCAGRGSASWADVAREIFKISEELDGPSAKVNDITSAEFPSRVTRPQNSQLDCSKIEQIFGIALPHWTVGVKETVALLIQETKGNNR